MRNIEKEIQEGLDAIEKKYNVKILYAIESGYAFFKKKLFLEF